MANVRQTSFLGGELAPQFWGRVDLPIWPHGLKRCENFFLSRQGAAVSRPGTRYVNLARMTGNPSTFTSSIRLVPFVYSDTQSFVLEVGFTGGFGYIRVHSYNVSTQTDTTTDISAPWALADIGSLQWAQQGAVLIFTHPSYAPQQLTWDGVSSWTLSTVATDPPYTNDWTEPPDMTQTDLAPAIVKYQSTAPASNVADTNFTPTTPDATHPLRPWQWLVTSIMQDKVRGTIFETRPFLVTQFFNGNNNTTYVNRSTIVTGGAAPALPYGSVDNIVLYPDKPVVIRRLHSGTRVAPAGYVVLGYNFYRGNNGIYGYVGTATGLDFTDMGDTPNYAIQPLLQATSARSPFLVGATNDYPAAVAYYEARRVFAGTPFRPGTLMLSATNNYINFDVLPLPFHGQPLFFDLASRKRERIRSMVGLHNLIVITDTAAWAVSGGSQGQPVDYDTVTARVIDEVGGTNLLPVVADGVVYYVRSRGIGIHALTPAQGYWSASDASTHAGHLFVGSTPIGQNTIVDWCYAREPWGVGWAVRQDGTLLSFTPTSGGVAWAKHFFNAPGNRIGVRGGIALSVCSVPEGKEDVVYVAVSFNTTEIVLLRLESRVIKGNGGQVFAGSGYTEPLDDLGCVDGSYKFSAAGGATLFTVPSGVATLLTNLQTNFTPLWVTARGNAPQLCTISGTTINFSTPLVANDGAGSCVGFVGAGFTPEMELLDVVSSETRLRQRSVVKVGFEVDSAQGVYVGQDATHLVEAIRGLSSAAYVSDYTSAQALYSPVTGTNDSHGRAVLRQALPLPLAVLGVTREVDFGG